MDTTLMAPAERKAFEPQDLDGAMVMAHQIAASGLAPRALAKPEAIVTVAVIGRELGLTLMQSLRSIHVIEGKPVLSADLIGALVKASPACEWFRLVSSDAKAATYETQRRGEPSSTSMTYTMDDAGRAGLAGKPTWRAHPAAMLRARCITALARAVYPDVAMGLYSPEEMEADDEPRERPARKRREAEPAVETTADVVVAAEPAVEATAVVVEAHPWSEYDAAATVERLAALAEPQREWLRDMDAARWATLDEAQRRRVLAALTWATVDEPTRTRAAAALDAVLGLDQAPAAPAATTATPAVTTATPAPAATPAAGSFEEFAALCRERATIQLDERLYAQIADIESAGQWRARSDGKRAALLDALRALPMRTVTAPAVAAQEDDIPW